MHTGDQISNWCFTTCAVTWLNTAKSESSGVYLQVSSILLIVQVGQPVDKVIEDSARYEPFMNIISSTIWSMEQAMNVYKKKTLTPAVRSARAVPGSAEQTPATEQEGEPHFPAEPELKYYTQKER